MVVLSCKVKGTLVIYARRLCLSFRWRKGLGCLRRMSYKINMTEGEGNIHFARIIPTVTSEYSFSVIYFLIISREIKIRRGILQPKREGFGEFPARIEVTATFDLPQPDSPAKPKGKPLRRQR